MISPTLKTKRIIIDTDPGVDDALAIFLALRSPELKVEAITAVAGNVPVELTVANALRLVEIAGRPDIPVAVGADRPLARGLITATHAHGENGLSGVVFPDAKNKPAAEYAPDLIRRIVRESPGEISIVAIGPLTNLALAFRDDPELPAMIKGITIMGGSLSGGNITPAAEFNFYVDPEAADAVFRAGAPITMIGLDVTRKAALRDMHVEALEASADPAGRAAGRLMRRCKAEVTESGVNGGRLLAHDAMAMAVAIDPSFVTLERLQIRIETAGDLTAGESLGYRKAPRLSAPMANDPANTRDATFRPNADVATDVDSDRFLDFLIGRLTGS